MTYWTTSNVTPDDPEYIETSSGRAGSSDN